MKKLLILLLSIFLITGCSKVIKFQDIENDTNGFHRLYTAEKMDDRIIYKSGKKLLYSKDKRIDKVSESAKNIWIENDDVYFEENDILLKRSKMYTTF